MTELTSQMYFNPFFLENRTVAHFVFFKDGEEVYTSKCGWFGSNRKEQSLYIGENVKKKLKKDYSVKKSYYMTNHLKNCVSNVKCPVNIFLYIDGKDIDVTFGETYEETTERSIYTWQPVTIKIFDKVYEERFIVKTEQTDIAKEVEQMQKQLNDEGIKMDLFVLQDLMKKYNLVKK